MMKNPKTCNYCGADIEHVKGREPVNCIDCILRQSHERIKKAKKSEISSFLGEK
jgi:hypothetical protein